jgi:hypothetical protein
VTISRTIEDYAEELAASLVKDLRERVRAAADRTEGETP